MLVPHTYERAKPTRTEDSQISDQLVGVRRLEQVPDLHALGKLSTNDWRQICLSEVVERFPELQRGWGTSEPKRRKLLLDLLGLGEDELGFGKRSSDHFCKE